MIRPQQQPPATAPAGQPQTETPAFPLATDDVLFGFFTVAQWPRDFA